ncbi:hypothetical protein IT6_02480 [Methylacidiphilum caldifontis]|uniref:hypothetical protein n=1 Tax=Methylacidiphilum caldifontis TaxID=2795386 RepID=UPI001A8EAAF3|nr:hypothetical protein [Methylacidiphilum caldifontis]QSR89171.1 hypothetical protein IT6_02480 [Methylacidiphilum caldifontis]
MAKKKENKNDTRLTEYKRRRAKVLALSFLGYSYEDISREIGLSTAVVDSYLREANEEIGADEWNALKTGCIGAYQKAYLELEEEKRMLKATGKSSVAAIRAQVEIIDSIVKMVGFHWILKREAKQVEALESKTLTEHTEYEIEWV